MQLTTRTLGEISDEVNGVIQTGPFGSQLHQHDYQEEGTPVIMPKDIVEGKVSTESIARVGREHVERLKKHQLEIGDIVCARRGDIGRRARVRERETGWLCGTGCMRISLGQSVIDPVFLDYYLAQPRLIKWLYNQAVGATMPNLNTSIIRSIPITYPPLSVQRRIAAILSTYDDLIENNTRRIAILEQMAQLLYREWFVHFRFPGHEDVQRVESELGLIPTGWEVTKLDEVIKLKNGKAIKAKEIGQYPVYGSNGIIGKTDKARYQNGVIIGRVGAYCGSTRYCKSKFWASDNTIVARAVNDETLSIELIYQLLTNLNLRRYAGGSAQPLLTQTVLKNLKVVVPDSSTNSRFKAMIEPMNDQIINLRQRNSILSRTRDLLLPRLISGEVDVSDLEIEV